MRISLFIVGFFSSPSFSLWIEWSGEALCLLASCRGWLNGRGWFTFLLVD